MQMITAGPNAEIERYFGNSDPYATSHEALDLRRAIQEEVRIAVRTMLEAVKARRAGRLVSAGAALESAREKQRPGSRHEAARDRKAARSVTATTCAARTTP